MPWRTTCPMDERTRFIAARLAGDESMSGLCRQFGVSRKTGYKLWARYQAGGPAALLERSHAAHRQPRAVAAAVQEAIVSARAAHPTWGPRKLKAWLAHRHPGHPWPAASTIGALLRRAGWIAAPGRRARATPSPWFSAATGPNDVWTVDFKGWFHTGDGRRCDPLTILDAYSRYLLDCRVVRDLSEPAARPVFEALFRAYGLPRVIRTDNGAPFASVAAGGLSRLAVWWVRAGIRPERIAPGHPEQNARHERLHRTLKQEATRPPQATAVAQQGAFDRFRQEYNHERPHEALGQRPPAASYQPSPRVYRAPLPELEYPAAYRVRPTHPNGEINWLGRRVFINQAVAGERLGLHEIADGCWAVYLGPLELGWLDARRPERLQRTAAPTRPLQCTPDLSPIRPV